ncbi:28S ribosomal protein S27, mitochondrial [Ischnura elegans]|uniref:28S ribosomal protein S27, mitochondrial n=1 Tax=Ischnura elegans TaxID=197161 RepID=UPI001ED881C2|nr:28S ribosomal protein S27, mitochondrial [Ischnura elegans]
MNGFSRYARTVFRIRSLGVRYFLSEAYKCQEAWSQRLNSPVIKKINIDEMYRDLDQTFNTKGKASAIDVDLFSCSVTDESYADELEDIIHRFRLSPSTSDMLQSTPHVVIRSLIDMGKFEPLMRILNDRLNYGIFPDYYCSNLLMDLMLKQGQYRDAARVATFQMLQEDWNHPVTACFCLYACHMYLNHKENELWEPEPMDEPVEEVKVRVKYIRNPYFDDHFDLRDTNHLIGKTFVIMSRGLPENDPIRKSYELIGWALYEKWDKAKRFLEKLKSSKEDGHILMEVVSMIEKAFSGDVKSESKDQVQALLDMIKSLPKDKLREEQILLSGMEERLKQAISQQEKKDITSQIELYSNWDKERVQLLKEQIELYERQMRLKKVEEKKKELAEKEEVLFFFDKKDELEMMIEKNEEIKRSQKVEEKKKKKETDENYVPPEI